VRDKGTNESCYKCKTKTDSFYSLGEGLIVKLLNVNTSTFVARPFALKMSGVKYLDFYDKPKPATTLGIYIASGLEDVFSYSIKSLHNGFKCLVLPSEIFELGEDDDTQIEYIIIPLMNVTVELPLSDHLDTLRKVTMLQDSAISTT
jgi:hypothetical protein